MPAVPTISSPGFSLAYLISSGDRMHRQRRIDDQRESHLRRQRDRHEVLARIVGQALVDGGVGGERRAGHQQQRVAVGRRFGERDGRDHRAAARPVLDQHRLAEALRQLLSDGAGDEVHSAARRERHHQRDRPVRKILRERCRRRLAMQRGEGEQAREQAVAATAIA